MPADSQRNLTLSIGAEISEWIDGSGAIAGEIKMDEGGAAPECERYGISVGRELWGGAEHNEIRDEADVMETIDLNENSDNCDKKGNQNVAPRGKCPGKRTNKSHSYDQIGI
jgi:hypothetical protein